MVVAEAMYRMYQVSLIRQEPSAPERLLAKERAAGVLGADEREDSVRHEDSARNDIRSQILLHVVQRLVHALRERRRKPQRRAIAGEEDDSARDERLDLAILLPALLRI